MSGHMTDRPGVPVSGEVNFGSGDNSPQTVLDTRDDAVFEINQIIVEYTTGGTQFSLTVHDDSDGTSSGNLNDALKTANINIQNAGERVVFDNLMMRDFQEDVIVDTDDSHDADVDVYVDGKIITDAAIVDG